MPLLRFGSIKLRDTAKGEDCIRVIDRIGVTGENGLLLLMIKWGDPTIYHWLFPYPGDRQLSLHSDKALLRRYWRADIEHMAKELKGDDKNGAEGGNYHIAHHHITVIHETMIASCVSIRLSHEMIPRHVPRYRNGCYTWLRRTRRLSFGPNSCSKISRLTWHMALRTALRTGNFKVLLAALPRLAPFFVVDVCPPRDDGTDDG